MIRDVTIGKYYAAKSVIHRLDPRTKLMGALVYIVTLFMIDNPAWYILSMISVLIMYHIAHVPNRYLLKGLKGVIILLFFTVVFRMFITPGNEIAQLWIFTVTQEGIIKGVTLASRIALMIAGASLLSYTSTPRDLADGLEKAFSFLEKFKVPIHEMSIMVMITFRFIPIMTDEANSIMDAQAARGAEFEKASVIKKTKNIFSLLVPLFMSTMRKSLDLAMAMEARGYSGEGETSKMYPMKYSRPDMKSYACILVYFLFFLTITVFDC